MKFILNNTKSSKQKLLPAAVLIAVLYFLIHLPGLVKLPVFADEAIYIRWAQLIIDDWRQYLFFPLNDGKTPLFIWLLVPFQFLFDNPLFAGRFVSVLAGLGQIFLNKKIVQILGGSKKTQWLTVVLTAVLPFWYFHHHLALMDGLLTLMLSLTLFFILKNLKQLQQTQKNSLILILAAGLSFGGAMWVKLPAILFAPSLIVISLLFKDFDFKKRSSAVITTGTSLLIGILVFFILKSHPAFGQLFSRGGDFLHPWREVVFAGKWRQTLPSWPNYLNYFGTYLTWPVLILSLCGLATKKKKTVLSLHLGWTAFAAPILLLGKVVYPRYLMPVSLFFTLAAAVSFNELIKKTIWAKLPAYLLAAAALFSSSQFIWANLNNSAQINFVEADKVQYLKEWSAGYGVAQTAKLVQDLAQNENILVLTEGYFGTLPDGLLMYLHRRDVSNLFVTGIGQPINTLPSEIKNTAANYDRVLLAANSHRLGLNLQDAELVYEKCRPFNSPCHQVWDITSLLKQ